MDPAVISALIAVAGSLLLALLGYFGRDRSKAQAVIRRAQNVRELAESYCFDLRRQIKASGETPRPWPQGLRYMNRDDPDEGMSDDDS